MDALAAYLHEMMATTQWKERRDYARAQRHFVKVSGMEDANAEMLLEWSGKGAEGEQGLFLTRAVLQ